MFVELKSDRGVFEAGAQSALAGGAPAACRQQPSARQTPQAPAIGALRQRTAKTMPQVDSGYFPVDGSSVWAAFVTGGAVAAFVAHARLGWGPPPTLRERADARWGYVQAERRGRRHRARVGGGHRGR